MNNISLHYFITVAEELNITKAAARLFITQQSLSEHIKKLEKTYNAVFFERSPRLRLTYQGERMLAYARKVVEAEHELKDKLREDRELKRVRLTIGQTSSRSAVFMPTIFCNYHEMYPNVVLSILNGNHEYIDNQLRLGKIEMYMGLSDNGIPYEKGETLYQDKLYFIISRELLREKLGEGAEAYIARHRNGIGLPEACAFPLVLPPRTSKLRPIFDELLTRQIVTPDTILETAEHDILFDVCQRGLCGCFVSRELLYRKIMHKSLPDNVLYFPAAGFDNLTRVELVYNSKNLSPHAIAFLNCCRETVKQTMKEVDNCLLDTGSIKA